MTWGKFDRACGKLGNEHCECSWVHDVCCRCGAEWGEGGRREDVVRRVNKAVGRLMRRRARTATVMTGAFG